MKNEGSQIADHHAFSATITGSFSCEYRGHWMTMANQLLESEVLESLSRYVASLCDVPMDDINHSAHLLDLGMDSLSVVKLVNFVRENFGYEITIVEFFHSPSIGSLTSVICKSTGNG
jgi:acyl carrier protein